MIKITQLDGLDEEHVDIQDDKSVLKFNVKNATAILLSHLHMVH